MPVTVLDVIVIVVVLISAGLAMVRGFVREVLSVASWVAAAAAAYYFYKSLLPLVEPYFDNRTIAIIVSAAVIFFVALIIASATAARAASIAVSIEALRARAQAVRSVNVALAGFASAQLVYPAAEAVVKLVVLVGVVDERSAGVRNMSAGGWFNFAAAALVFGVPGAMFMIQAGQHARRHGLGLGPRVLGAVGGIACLGLIGAVIGTS